MSEKNAAPHWPADRVERWPLSRLMPYARNARTHSAAQIDQIVASIKEWGWTVPVLVDEAGTIIAGHGRVLAAQKLGLADAPVMVARGWSEAQKRAYALADNKLALNAGWDDDLLKIELADLRGLDFDLGKIGFSDTELQVLLSPLGGTDPDAAPEPPANPVPMRGDVWTLGRHRLVCGDATSADDVRKALDGEAPLLMVTDPPYGVNYDPAWRDGVDLGIGQRSKGTVTNDDRADWREAWALFPGQVAYVWHAGCYASIVQQSLESQRFAVRNQIIWVKQHFVLSRGDYHWQHEPCWYAVRDKGHWTGDRKQTTIWEIANNNSFGNASKEQTWGHGTQKPVECMRRPIENNSLPSEAVYDPFLGSGTTLIAAEMTGRRCLAIEISPEYLDVTVQRWQTYANKTATLESTGQAFADVAAERQVPIAA